MSEIVGGTDVSPAEVDLVIRGGKVVDGSGRESFRADVAVLGDIIVAVGAINARAKVEVDATDCIVTPGFVDIHTHYDGQAIWSDRLDPSSQHGVTTVVAGNCGVGFAPCRSEDREVLLEVMEGVEDIPGAVMSAGLTWDWESFPDYLDVLERRRLDADIAVYLAHSPLRVFVMGTRGVEREKATQDDLRKMRRLAAEAIEAGALGCATSRVFVHRTSSGRYIPTYGSAEAELRALVDGMADAGGGILQMVGNIPEDGWEHDLGMMKRLAHDSGRPVTFTMGASPEAARHAADIQSANEAGARLTGQIYPRPIGLIMAFNLSWNPFSFCPSYGALAALPERQRIERLRSAEVRAQLLAETPEITLPLPRRTRDYQFIFPLTQANPNYEPKANGSVAALAAAAQQSPAAWAYDYLVQNDGRNQLLVCLGNYVGGSLDILRELMEHPNLVLGLGDGGAHYGLICDASYPSFVLSHWVRDRSHGRIPLGQAVASLTRRPAEVVNLLDRGLLRQGYKADINVIDAQALALEGPQAVWDLPGGGKRLVQRARGYRATIVSGRVTYREGAATDALPGRLVRGAQRDRSAPAAHAALSGYGHR